MEIINVSDIVEANGKTIRENNMEKIHNIPIGSLVEVKFDKWLGNGACKKVHARLFVYSHNRDCDGTPLYSLSETHPDKMEMDFGSRLIKMAWYGIETGFAEKDLTVVPITQELLKGEDALEWKE